MGQFDSFSRAECVRLIKSNCRNVRTCVTNRGHNPESWAPAELEYRTQLVELRQRLLVIETEERDALATELQKRQSILEENRATTHE